MRRLLLSASGVMVIVMAAAGGAAAQGYPPSAGALSVGTSVPTAGGDVVVSGVCPTEGLALTITIDPPAQKVGETITGAGGSFSATITVPTDVSGNATITAADAAQTCVLAAVVTVAKASPLSALAFSGSDSTMKYAGVGVVLVAVGAALVVSALRRRRVQSHTS